MSDRSLEVALRLEGIPCSVEERGKLAIVLVGDGFGDFASRELRVRVIALAREHGFASVAVEIPESGEAVRRG
jgi:hypothetical protein